MSFFNVTSKKTRRVALKSGFLDQLKKVDIHVDKGLLSLCEEELSAFDERVSERFDNYLGYPNGILSGFLPESIVDRLLLNIGDWRGNKYLGPNTHEYEAEATDYLKEIFDFPYGAKEWGNSCTGSSEAVLAAIVYARSVLSAKAGMAPVVIASKEAHYCARKNAGIAGLEFFSVNTDRAAGMDMVDLRRLLDIVCDSPVIVIATCGTTVREGYDPVCDICELLEFFNVDFYVHIDAALCGLTAPFLDEVAPRLKPRFHKGVSSISVSLHKFASVNRPSALLLGIDYHCGDMPMMRRVDYIDATDGTPSGSRNGHPVLAFAMLYRLIGRNGFTKMARSCLKHAHYLTQKLRAYHIEVFHNPGALTVFVPRPSDEIVDKYTLACSDGGAHVITMQHVDVALLDRFINDYVEWAACNNELLMNFTL